MNVDSRAIVHAGDYLEKEMHFCFDSQKPMIQVIQIMDQHPFVKWGEATASYNSFSHYGISYTLRTSIDANSEVNLMDLELLTVDLRINT